jgi:hypothetical protein
MAASPPHPLTPSPPHSLWRRVGFFCLDLLGIAGWTWLAIEIPLPVINEYLTIKNAIIAFAAVVAVGRAIVDRIYDREA